MNHEAQLTIKGLVSELNKAENKIQLEAVLDKFNKNFLEVFCPTNVQEIIDLADKFNAEAEQKRLTISDFTSLGKQ